VTKLGFVIDHEVCIGCHACTVACKSENDVPLGDFRTWVKQVESGTFPDTQRSFLVERCNHCENAPCVGICPVTALYKRDDGIVDFNSDQCIGCRACQAACPYDAIYMDSAQGGTVAKCNFCSHRIDQGLEPACVIVCPPQAILFGDLNDPQSEVAMRAASAEAARPREWIGTEPQLSYIGADLELMAADRTSEAPSPMMTSAWNGSNGHLPIAETGTPHDVYNVSHESPWHFLVSAYLGTKSVATGAALLGALALGFGYEQERDVVAVAAPAIGLIFITLTALFLVIDLERPERFLRILLQPNWTSWLAIGGYLLSAFGLVSAVWLIAELAGGSDAIAVIAWVSLPFSLAAAIYTAFLFGQAPGRELWQTWVFTPHLLARAVIGGAAALQIVLAFAETEREPNQVLAVALLAGLGVSALATLVEFSRRGTTHLRRASDYAVRGEGAPLLWIGAGAGHVAAAVLAAAYLAADGAAGLLVAAAIISLVSLLALDEVWVRAGQSVPQT
jgi:Fe-S-cluster-containing dehydrogenase component/formate-dependent nitrite reductase membrane component NrfD